MSHAILSSQFRLYIIVEIRGLRGAGRPDSSGLNPASDNSLHHSVHCTTSLLRRPSRRGNSKHQSGSAIVRAIFHRKYHF